MDIFETEAWWPTRALQQDEEEQAQSSAQAALTPPAFEWHAGGAAAADHLQPDVLVVATTPAASTLLQHCSPHKAPVASLVPGGAAPASGVSVAPLLRLHAPADRVLLASLEGVLPAEAAGAWADALLEGLQPARVLVLGSLQAEQYRGEGDPSQGPLVYLLQTSARQQQARELRAPPVPLLQTGNVVGGLAAALLTTCQLRGSPAELLVSVDMVRALLPDSVPALAAAAAALLASGAGAGSAAQLAAWLGDASCVSVARESMERAVTPSAVYA